MQLSCPQLFVALCRVGWCQRTRPAKLFFSISAALCLSCVFSLNQLLLSWWLICAFVLKAAPYRSLSSWSLSNFGVVGLSQRCLEPCFPTVASWWVSIATKTSRVLRLQTSDTGVLLLVQENLWVVSDPRFITNSKRFAVGILSNAARSSKVLASDCCSFCSTNTVMFPRVSHASPPSAHFWCVLPACVYTFDHGAVSTCRHPSPALGSPHVHLAT